MGRLKRIDGVLDESKHRTSEIYDTKNDEASKAKAADLSGIGREIRI
jgi:hypothetical protein